jgi:hypothetical protein
MNKTKFYGQIDSIPAAYLGRKINCPEFLWFSSVSTDSAVIMSVFRIKLCLLAFTYFQVYY